MPDNMPNNGNQDRTQQGAARGGGTREAGAGTTGRDQARDSTRESTQSNPEGQPSTQQLKEQGQQIGQGAQDIVSGSSELLRQAEELLRIQVEQRPYTVLGAALGVGYVLGGGVPAFAMRMLVNSGMRMAMGAVVGVLLEKQKQ